MTKYITEKDKLAKAFFLNTHSGKKLTGKLQEQLQQALDEMKDRKQKKQLKRQERYFKSRQRRDV